MLAPLMADIIFGFGCLPKAMTLPKNGFVHLKKKKVSVCAEYYYSKTIGNLQVDIL